MVVQGELCGTETAATKHRDRLLNLFFVSEKARSMY